MALPDLLRRGLNAIGIYGEEPGTTVSPVAAASPSDDDAPPTIGGMISSANGGGWIPQSYLSIIASNDDPILGRDGQGIKLYDQLLSDETAASTLQQRRLAITSRNWEVAPGDPEDPRSVKAADDFRAMLQALGFDRPTGLLHYGIWYGYAVGEFIYSMKQHDGRTIVWLDDIVVPDRRHFAFTVQGELRLAAAGRGFGEEKLPPNKFVTVRTGGTHDFAFYGLGLAHWCYWPIFFKRAGLKFWALYLEKLGAPTVAIEFTAAEQNDPVAKQRKLEAAVAVGQDRAVLFPEGTLTNNLVKILETGRTGPGSGGYEAFVSSQDEALMRVVLGSPGTSKATPGGLGGDGQARKDEGVKAELVKADSDLISEALNRTVATYLTRWNHGPDVKPPTVYRVLDDAEDLNVTAERDAKLDGIGIKRTDESVRDVYGDGYERVEVTPPPALMPGATPGAGGNVVDLADARKAALKARALAFGVNDAAPLYISRKLTPESAREVLAWARSQGFKSPVPASDLHVTILYSKTPVDWFAMGDGGWGGDELVVSAGGPRTVERFGHGDPADSPAVLRFASGALKWRHEELIERGASSDYAEYKPHVSISYDDADLDLSAVEPFTGELRFGPEIFEPIRTSTDPASLDFTAADEAAIERLIAASVDRSSPLFEAIAHGMRDKLQGVTTVEGARVAILEAVEKFDPTDLAEALALPLLGVRAGAVVGAESEVVA